MKLFRNNQVCVSDKCLFYAHLLAKALLKNEGTIDQLVDAELIDKWEREFPDLVLAYERNCELKQANKKAYDLAEKEILGSLTRTLEQQPTEDRPAGEKMKWVGMERPDNKTWVLKDTNLT